MDFKIEDLRIEGEGNRGYVVPLYNEDGEEFHLITGVWEELDSLSFLSLNVELENENEIIIRKNIEEIIRGIVSKDIDFITKDKRSSSIIVTFNNGDSRTVENWGKVNIYLDNERMEKMNNPLGITTNKTRDNVIITLLSSNIEKEMKKISGKNYMFCPNYSEILSIKSLSSPLSCKGSYLITVRVRSASISNTPLNEKIMEFIVDSNGIKYN